MKFSLSGDSEDTENEEQVFSNIPKNSLAGDFHSNALTLNFGHKLPSVSETIKQITNR